MDFQKIKAIEKPQFYLDVAFKRATKQADSMRTSIKGPALVKSKRIEREKLVVTKKTLEQKLRDIVQTYPDLSKLPIFYKELIKSTLDFGEIKKSLGGVQWAITQINRFFTLYTEKIKRTGHIENINKYRKEFTGRISSVLNQIKKELAYLEQARRILREFPMVKTDMPTIILAGYPNVGKTTLLKALTGSSPKIASYPFTTQNLMLGYARGMQFVDTPGLLDRPLGKRNKIEQQSILALKHLTDVIVFVFDPSESCGYKMEKQLQLLKQIREGFKRKIIIVSNKTDIDHEKVKGISVSGKTKKGIKELWDAINELI